MLRKIEAGTYERHASRRTCTSASGTPRGRAPADARREARRRRQADDSLRGLRRGLETAARTSRGSRPPSSTGSSRSSASRLRRALRRRAHFSFRVAIEDGKASSRPRARRRDADGRFARRPRTRRTIDHHHDLVPLTSAKPSEIVALARAARWCAISTSPARSAVKKRSWRGSTPKSPSVPGQHDALDRVRRRPRPAASRW